jgi:hypothetical protein
VVYKCVYIQGRGHANIEVLECSIFIINLHIAGLHCPFASRGQLLGTTSGCSHHWNLARFY